MRKPDFLAEPNHSCSAMVNAAALAVLFLPAPAAHQTPPQVEVRMHAQTHLRGVAALERAKPIRRAGMDQQLVVPDLTKVCRHPHLRPGNWL